jgi:hypothetical protein
MGFDYGVLASEYLYIWLMDSHFFYVIGHAFSDGVSALGGFLSSRFEEYKLTSRKAD